jgi:hypothetical protein
VADSNQASFRKTQELSKDGKELQQAFPKTVIKFCTHCSVRLGGAFLGIIICKLCPSRAEMSDRQVK